LVCGNVNINSSKYSFAFFLQKFSDKEILIGSFVRSRSLSSFSIFFDVCWGRGTLQNTIFAVTDNGMLCVISNISKTIEKWIHLKVIHQIEV
jgi:hypothetical protein